MHQIDVGQLSKQFRTHQLLVRMTKLVYPNRKKKIKIDYIPIVWSILLIYINFIGPVTNTWHLEVWPEAAFLVLRLAQWYNFWSIGQWLIAS